MIEIGLPYEETMLSFDDWASLTNEDALETACPPNHDEPSASPQSDRGFYGSPTFPDVEMSDADRLCAELLDDRLLGSIPPTSNSEVEDSSIEVPVHTFNHTKPISLKTGMVNAVFMKERKSNADLENMGVHKEEPKNRRNAIIAKQNREKKKKYIQELEAQLEKFKSENERLTSEMMRSKKRIKSLEDEAEYQRNLLVNDSALAGMLVHIRHPTKSLRIGTDLITPDELEDHDYGTVAPKRRKRPKTTGGVCVHVDKDNMSVVACRTCAATAGAALRK